MILVGLFFIFTKENLNSLFILFQIVWFVFILFKNWDLGVELVSLFWKLFFSAHTLTHTHTHKCIYTQTRTKPNYQIWWSHCIGWNLKSSFFICYNLFGANKRFQLRLYYTNTKFLKKLKLKSVSVTPPTWINKTVLDFSVSVMIWIWKTRMKTSISSKALKKQIPK